MGQSAQKPGKIPLLFILGIGIPCLLLGYLAFRGIQNDQALLEKERLNKHREILDLVTKSVEENILNAELAGKSIIVEQKESDQSVPKRYGHRVFRSIVAPDSVAAAQPCRVRARTWDGFHC